MANRWEQCKQWLTLFLRAPKSLQMVTAAMKLKMLTPWKESYDQPTQHIKKQRHYFASKCPSSQDYGFFSSHVWMWKLDSKETERQRIDTFELWCWRRLESPWDFKNIQPVNPKGGQNWRFIRRTDVEAETLILWPSDVKCWLICKDPDAGKDWWWEEKGMTEDEMDGWYYRLNGYEFK